MLRLDIDLTFGTLLSNGCWQLDKWGYLRTFCPRVAIKLSLLSLDLQCVVQISLDVQIWQKTQVYWIPELIVPPSPTLHTSTWANTDSHCGTPHPLSSVLFLLTHSWHILVVRPWAIPCWHRKPVHLRDQQGLQVHEDQVGLEDLWRQHLFSGDNGTDEQEENLFQMFSQINHGLMKSRLPVRLTLQVVTNVCADVVCKSWWARWSCWSRESLLAWETWETRRTLRSHQCLISS